MVLAAKVWTYWISWVLIASAVLMLAGIAVGYLVRVTAKRAPRQ